MIVTETKELILKKNELLKMLDAASDDEKAIIEEELKVTLDEINRINKEAIKPKVEEPIVKKEKKIKPIVTADIKEAPKIVETIKMNAPYTYNLLTLEPIKLEQNKKEITQQKSFRDNSMPKILFELIYSKQCKDYLELLSKLHERSGKSYYSCAATINFFMVQVSIGKYEHLTVEDIKPFK